VSVLISIVSGFATGIFLRTVLTVGWPVAAFALVLATLLAGAALRKGRRLYALGALLFVFVALGVGRTALFETPLPSTFASDLRHRVSYEGVVAGDPQFSPASVRIPVVVQRRSEVPDGVGGEETGVLAIVPLTRYEEVAVGERVRLTGTLGTPEPFASEGGRIFRYDKYLEARGTRFLVEYGSLWRVEPAPWYSVPAAFARVKHWFLAGLARTLPAPDSALAGGIVIGGKAGLPPEWKDAFIKTGLVQIIVLSGYNVMVVANGVASLLSFLSIRRRWATGAGVVALLFFVGVAGLSATAIRATLMAVIALYARATGKTYAASRALLVVALLMLLWNPYLLAFDPGFDLSVVATAGLVWLAPLIEAKLTFIKRGKNILATTLAAQLAVLPLLLYETGNLSLVAVLANLLVAPVVPLAMALGAIAGTVGASLGGIVPAFAQVVGAPLHLVTSYIVFVATTSASIPGASYALPAFPFTLVVLAYAALVAIAASKRASGTRQLTLAKKASTYFDFSAGL